MTTVTVTKVGFIRDPPGMRDTPPLPDGYAVEHGIVTTPDGRTASHGFQSTIADPCGGVSVNGADPICCEVHMLPWGHNDRARDPGVDSPTDPTGGTR